MAAKRTKKTETIETEEVLTDSTPVNVAELSDAVDTGSDEGADASDASTTDVAKVAKKAARTRGQKYATVRAKVDRTKTYDPLAAIELVKALSFAKFDGTIIADVVVTEEGMSAPLTLPHSTGKTLRVVIADDAVLEKVAAGNIDFDILVATPQLMPKLAKYAPILGPRGLMPNPKNGTISADPEGTKKRLEGGTVTIRTEKKAPLMHIRIGKTSMETANLVANLQELISVLSKKLKQVVISSSMSPGVKVTVS
jgi:large subunit ribosomal protein L1